MRPSIVAGEVRAALFDYLRTTFGFSDQAFEDALFGFLERELVKGPWVDLKLPFRQAMLHEGAEAPLAVMPPFAPYAHQMRSFERLSTVGARSPQATLVTTGTGSGKTECFLWPILDHCLRHHEDRGIKAIILYPMNALATDQAKRIAEELSKAPFAGKVRAGLYVGGQGSHATMTEEHLIDDRKILRQAPPDILLTNYRMLDFLLLRPEDQALWARDKQDSLRYLVLDELHTYDGAQATDVACLVRRLKRRLGVPTDGLACVGTSATLGSRGGDDPSGPLRAFAAQVFDEAFPLASVVTEDRQSMLEALGPLNPADPAQAPYDALPGPKDLPGITGLAGLVPGSPDTAAWLRRHTQAFLQNEDGRPADVFDDHEDLDPIKLGDALARHSFLRATLRLLQDGPLTVEALIERLAAEDPVFAELDEAGRRTVLDGLLTLVGEAQRRAPGGRTAPFLQLQVQLWVRELRRLLQKIPEPTDPGPVFRFADAADANASSDAKALPIAHCRHCGGHGLAGLLKASATRVMSAPGQIGSAWLDRHPDARYLRLLPEAPALEELVPLRLHPERLDLCAQVEASFGPKVEVSPQERPKRFTSTCPECGEQESLRILGARGPSLLSVAVSHLFLTSHNEDRKLISFVDRVQDAAHLAGFFGARTYRFNLRTALQGALQEAEGPRGTPLAGLSKRLYAFAKAHLPSEASVVATLVPPDLKAQPTYAEWHQEPEGPALPKMLKDLKARLEWEVTREYGFGSDLGRTLQRTGSSCAHPDSDRLDAAAARLCADLKEQAVLQMAPAAPTEDETRRFLAGLCHRLRVRGGVHSPLLNSYVVNGGVRFLLSKKKNPLFSPLGFSQGAPRFLTSAFKSKEFDSRYSSPSQPSWLRTYAAAALNSHVRDEGLNTAIEKALNRLVETQIVREVRGSAETLYGLDPAHLVVTSQVTHIGCSTCGRGQHVPSWEAERWVGGACLHFRCAGRLSRSLRPPQRFYRQIYASGQLQRIFPAEHTGLLERGPREDLETRFKKGVAAHPEAENVLVATPTLEMGIDIGDLSAVALAGVPPGPANYLQRVGRAGRKTGHALTITLAEAKPHDAYFFEDPTEMLAGEVRPPGCYLDAPEMLKRQLVAYSMDCWAESQDTVHDIPRYTKALLGEAGERGFLGQFLAYFEKHRAELLEGFAQLFPKVQPRHLDTVRNFGLAQTEGLDAVVREAFARVAREEADINLLIRRLTKRIKALEVDPSLAPDADQAKKELEDDRSTLRSQRDALTHKYPLNTLTDEGVLPNYAFPEPGVTLTSKLRRQLDEQDAQGRHKTKVETHEYMRPASSALRELAPFNTFYAEGRKVRVSEVDIGTKERSRVESWRFCPACAHTERAVEGEPVADACPRCQAPGWADTGQVRRLVRFIRSMAFTDEIQALVEDDGDDRQNQSYATQVFIDVGPDNWAGALAVSSAGFGVEALKDQLLREVNFGFDDAAGRGFEAYGHKLPEAAFVVCSGCGRVKPPRGTFKGELRHAGWCTYAKNEALKPKLDDICLYREIKSEAVRIMVPALVNDVPQKLASFQAALDLGFREYFRGRPQHLLTETASEPIPGSSIARRHFVVVFDAVPGGTGYLGEVMPQVGGGTDKGLLKILSLALKAMRNCGCNREGLDGCHRCIRGFQPNHRLPNISRRVAEDLLEKDILAHAAELEKVGTLSEVSIDSVMESELELRFVARLKRWAEDHEGRLDAVLHNGKEAFELRFGGPSGDLWRLSPQVFLGPTQGVALACKPDFVLTPLIAPEAAKPVVIFCDGFAYHACPNAETARLGDDVNKRRAILASGDYRVWGLAWHDLDDTPSVPVPLVPGTKVGRQTVARRLGPTADQDLPERGTFDSLTRYLVRPDDAAWGDVARLHLASSLAQGPWCSPQSTGATIEALNGQYARPEQTASLSADRPNPLASVHQQPYATAAFTWPMQGIAKDDPSNLKASLRLYDTHQERQAPDYEQTWRAFLHAWAWLQFLPGLEVTTSELLAFESSAPPPEPEAPKTADLLNEAQQDELQVLLEIIENEDARILVEMLATWPDAPWPEPGWDTGPNNECLQQLELGWPALKLGIVIEGQEAGRAEFEALGWTIYALDELKGAQQLYTLLTGQPVPNKDAPS